MNKILFINACARPNSRTLELAHTVLNKIQGDVEEVNLYQTTISPIDFDSIEKRHAASVDNDFTDSLFDLAKQFASADVIVMAAPCWDMMFPAILKTYLENITVCGVSFVYSDEGIPQGMCKAKSLHYVTTAGGFIGQNDFGFSYVKALAQTFFGIQSVYRVVAEGLDLMGANVDKILQEAKDKMLVEEVQTIPVPEKYGVSPSLEGASSFDNTLDHIHSRYYVTNDFYNMKSDNTLHILSNFKTYQQTSEYTCGAASALMVLNWFGKEQYHENAIAQLLETDCTKGSSVENIADLFDLIGWNVEAHTSSTKRKFETVEDAENAIIDYIDRGIPMMIDWVDWAGHWAVLIGIDTCGTESPYDDVLVFADPYDVTDHNQDGYYTYPLGRFFGMWREGPCAGKTSPFLQPYVVAWPKN